MRPRGASLSDGCLPTRCRYFLPDVRLTVVIHFSTIVELYSVECGLDFLVSVIPEKEVCNSEVLVD